MKEYENPKITGINRLPGRSFYYPYGDTLSAMKYKREFSDRYFSLNGVWDIMFFDSPLLIDDEVLEEISCHNEECDCGHEWEKITVPSVVEREDTGYLPQYTNVQYPFPCDPPYIPSDNPTYLYRRFFTLPDHWDERVFLRFEGVDSAFYVYLNDMQVGFSKGSRLPAEFDITDYITDGENTLMVKVIKWSDASYLEDQDMWWESGIFRDVYLLARPESYIFNIKTDTVLDENYKNAELKIDYDLKNPEEGQTVLARLYDECEEIVSEKTVDCNVSSFSMDITDPEKWSAENPYLYKLIVSLLDSDGRELEVLPIRVGFRQIEMKKYNENNSFYNILVNGKPIIFKGVNRHEHHPVTGRALTEEIMLKDILIMKNLNINAVRTSHYCDDPKWYDLCDQYGIYLIDECDLETHGVGMPCIYSDLPSAPNCDEKSKYLILSDSDEWTDAYTDRMKRMTERDKNYPSVIVWSLGNESQFGKNHKAMTKAAKAISDRPVHYEGDYYCETVDVYSLMYPPHDKVEEIGKGALENYFKENPEATWPPLPKKRSEEMPFIMCEFVHSMGNGPGAIEEYTELFYKYPRLQGGFVWEWLDHGMEEWTEDGEMYYAYGGDFGESVHDGNFVADGLLFPNREPSPGAYAYKKAIEPVKVRLKKAENSILSLEIENRYDFSDLSGLCFSYSIEEEGAVIKSGLIPTPDIKARETKDFDFELPKFKIKKDKNYYIRFEFSLAKDTVWAKFGTPVAWEQFEISEAAPYSFNAYTGDTEVSENEEYIIVSGNDFSLGFSKYEGALTYWTYKGKELLSAPVKAEFWRPVIDNSCPSWMTYENKELFRMDKMQHRVKSCEVSFEGDYIKVDINSRIASPVISFGYDTEYIYLINAKGEFELTVKGIPWGLNRPKHIERVGLTALLPSELEYVKWFGRGPYESYADSKNFCPVSLYRGDLEDFYTPYVFPQEHGARSDTKWFEIFDVHGKGFKVTAGEKVMFSVSPFSDKTIDSAKHTYDLQPEDGVVLHIDMAQQGLGTASCGPGVLPKYTLKPEEFEFSLLFSAE